MTLKTRICGLEKGDRPHSGLILVYRRDEENDEDAITRHRIEQGITELDECQFVVFSPADARLLGGA